MSFVVYAVVYGNYYPQEIDSLHDTCTLAVKRREELDGDWWVDTMEVQQEPAAPQREKER